MDDVSYHRVDHVMAWKVDHPFRSVLHCLRTLEDLEHPWSTPGLASHA